MTPLDITRDIRKLALSSGADFFGIADLTTVRVAVVAQGGDALSEYARAISIGMALPDDIMDRLSQHGNPGVAREYEGVYDETNLKLDQIAESVAERLRCAGARVLSVGASRTIDGHRLSGLFSHKMAAHLAGLGWIGKSCLLITRRMGPRVRWTTVLTDVSLSPTGGPAEQACGECRQCVDSCPAQAFTGRPFRAEEQRDLRFAARKCHRYQQDMAQKIGSRVLCGLCVSVCPYGRRRKISPRTAP